jgi:hypothetical protein
VSSCFAIGLGVGRVDRSIGALAVARRFVGACLSCLIGLRVGEGSIATGRPAGIATGRVEASVGGIWSARIDAENGAARRWSESHHGQERPDRQASEEDAHSPSHGNQS